MGSIFLLLEDMDVVLATPWLLLLYVGLLVPILWLCGHQGWLERNQEEDAEE